MKQTSAVRPRRPRTFLAIAVLLLTGYQLARIVAFITVHGGIEHDGGWMLSISRSLAERGEYTSLVSTIADPAVRGAYANFKYDIQADDGRVWFFTGNGIGPSSIIPDALILRLFGTDFWALRLGPLLFHAGFLLLAAVCLYFVGGLGAVFLFHGFLFFYPHLSIFLGYEAMGEVPAMFYVLLALLLYARARCQTTDNTVRYFAAGVATGLAINAKLIALLSLGGLFMIAAGDVLARSVKSQRAERQGAMRTALMLVVGTVLPLALWEIIQFAILVRLAGFDAYQQHLQQRWWFVLNDGSGIGDRGATELNSLIAKFLAMREVAHPTAWVTLVEFLFLFVGGLPFVWRWRTRTSRESLFTCMWLGWLLNTVWFVLIAKTGWVRHDWFALVLAALLLSALAWRLLHHSMIVAAAPASMRPRDVASAVAGTLLVVLILWGFASQPFVRGFFLPDEIVPYWQAKQIGDRSGASLPWIIIPRAAQAEVADYIRHMPIGSAVYYAGGHKAAELTPLTGRIHFPLARRAYAGAQPFDVLVLGPSVVSPWLREDERGTQMKAVRSDCWKPLIVNDFYWLCALPGPATVSPRYTRMEAVFENGIRLLGYDAPESHPRAGNSFLVTLYWQADLPVARNYTVFVHMLGTTWNPLTNNPLWGQSDQQPASGSSATTTWQPGAVIADTHIFRISPDAPPGTYQLEIGMYLSGNGARLLTQDGFDHVIVAQVDVRP